MAVQAIHHFAINAPAQVLDDVVTFYGQLLGLTPGYRPDFGFNGHWLYVGDHPILHLLEDANREPGGTAYFDHIALRCEGLVETIEKLEAMGVEYHQFAIEELGQTQLFIRDPAGTAVELNFLEA
jgi:extradiol dioxygenase family protein